MSRLRPPAPLLGLITGVLVLLHLLGVFFFLFLPFALLKLLVPLPAIQRWSELRMMDVGTWWGRSLRGLVFVLHGTRWQVRGRKHLKTGDNYLLICNHQSWADIPVLAAVLAGKAAFPRFFVKAELIWVPVIGFACWAFGFPFMRRHSRAAVAADPSLAGIDLETTRAACHRFRSLPLTMVNFVEGTRGTEAKRRRQNSPYRHLLRPKSGGLALALNALDGALDGIVDVTIIYPPGLNAHLWNFLCGRLDPVHVRLEHLAIPPAIARGDYQQDPVYRQAVQRWLNERWALKDETIRAGQKAAAA